MPFPIWSPDSVEFIAILQHANRSEQRKRLRSSAGAERFTGSSITKRGGALIVYAEAAVGSDLHLTQCGPQCGLTCGEIHICGKIAAVQRAAGRRNKLIQCHSGIALCGNAVHMHIIHPTGDRVLHTTGTGIGLGMVCTIRPNLCAVRSCCEHGPYIARRAVLPEPCFMYASVCDIVYIPNIDYDL